VTELLEGGSGRFGGTGEKGESMSLSGFHSWVDSDSSWKRWSEEIEEIEVHLEQTGSVREGH